MIFPLLLSSSFIQSGWDIIQRCSWVASHWLFKPDTIYSREAESSASCLAAGLQGRRRRWWSSTSVQMKYLKNYWSDSRKFSTHLHVLHLQSNTKEQRLFIIWLAANVLQNALFTERMISIEIFMALEEISQGVIRDRASRKSKRLGGCLIITIYLLHMASVGNPTMPTGWTLINEVLSWLHHVKKYSVLWFMAKYMQNMCLVLISRAWHANTLNQWWHIC